MAYNSNKGNQHSGDIQYENDPNDTQIDFENDFVALKTNGNQAFVVSGSLVGIGTATPGAHPSGKNDLVIGNQSDHRGITIASGPTSISTIRFTYPTNANNGEGWIDYSNNSKKMRFGTNGLNTRVTIKDTGTDIVGQLSASLGVSGAYGHFQTLRASSIVGGSPISISASSITFTGSVDYGSTGSHGFYSGSAIHEFSATGSYTSGSGGSTEVSGGHIIISGSSPAITIHEGDLIVSGNTYLGDAVSDVVKMAAQLTASAGSRFNGPVTGSEACFTRLSSSQIFNDSSVGSSRMSITSLNGITITGSVQAGDNFTALGNTTLGNAAGDTLNITGRTTATGNVSASLGVTGSLLLATGSAASVAVGKKSPVNTNMLYVNTEGNDNRVPLLVVDTAEQTILAATGSGHVIVGGKGAPVIDAKLNVSGSDLDQLLSCRSDSYAQVFHVSGSGNTFVSGNLGLGTINPISKLDVNGDSIRIRTSNTPASAGAVGAPGEIRWDANYLYICIAVDTWKRVALSTW